MKFRLIAATALASALPFLAAPAFADTSDYRVIMQEHDIGHLTITRDGPKVSVDYDYKQNGRGPTITEELKLDADGAPIDWKIAGRTTFGNTVAETFKRSGAGVAWHDLAGPGTIKGKDAPALVCDAERIAARYCDAR